MERTTTGGNTTYRRIKPQAKKATQNKQNKNGNSGVVPLLTETNTTKKTKAKHPASVGLMPQEWGSVLLFFAVNKRLKIW
ncbi:MAG TPA: hypothetical protein DGG95_06035, partial [Cytophagales bacterium]|nr:hypothetical protein [Cytophagales bacterium]